jgi:hypothetical protein
MGCVDTATGAVAVDGEQVDVGASLELLNPSYSRGELQPS